FPEMWANTLWPFSSSTLNMALGRGSITVPSRTIASSLGLGRTDLQVVPTHCWAGQAARSHPAQGRRDTLARRSAEANSTLLSNFRHFRADSARKRHENAGDGAAPQPAALTGTNCG